MSAYISVLRGINVSGQKKIKMDSLKALYEALGLEDVQTYIQSGNVVFTSPDTNQAKLASVISEAIEKELGYQVVVLVRSVDDWKETVGNNPFHEGPGIDPGKLHITFLAEMPDKGAVDVLSAISSGPDEARVIGREVHLHCPNGYGRTKLSNALLERKLKAQATTRNWNTVNKLLELAQST